MAGSKRKKTVQAPVPDESESEEEQHSDEEGESQSEDEETAQVQKQKRKPQKRARKEIGEDVTLIAICKEHRDATDAAAKGWVQRLKVDRNAGVAEAMTLVVQAAGSKHVVDEDEVEEGNIDGLVSTVTEEIDQEGYVDLFKGKGHRLFRDAYLQLWDRIIQRLYEGDSLLVEPILEKVCQLATGLSSSDIRNFRYLGTLTACHVATCLVKTMANLADERDTAQAQEAAEAHKKGNKAAAERAKEFKRTASRCHQQINELQSYVTNVFLCVVSNRFRDASEEIRAVVTDCVGNWLYLNPAIYLKDMHMKYLAWALHDQEAVVRDAAIDALLALYKDADNLATMHEFTLRFKNRFLELPNDLDDGVAVKGVQLLTILVEADEIPADQTAHIYELLLEEAVGLREASADLIAARITDIGKRYFLKIQEKQRGRRRSLDNFSEAELQLGGLLSIINLLKSQIEEADEREEDNPQADADLVTQVVDPLFDRIGVLQDWNQMTKALLDDKACEARGEGPTTSLVLLLCAAVQRAAGGLHLSTHGHKKQTTGKAKAAAVSVDTHKQQLTMVLSKSLLRLLRRFQADAVKAGALVGTVRHLKLAVFALKKEEQVLEDILATVASLLEKHAHPACVRACCQALAFCANPEGDAPQEPGNSVFNTTMGRVAAALEEDVAGLLGMADEDLEAEAEGQEAGAEAGEEAFATLAGLTRAYYLLEASPQAAESPSLAEPLTALVKAAADGRRLPADLTAKAVQCVSLLLMWQLQQYLHDQTAPPPAWNTGVTNFAQQLHSLLGLRAGADLRVQSLAVRTLADFYLIFKSAEFKDVEGTFPALVASAEEAAALWGAAEAVLTEKVPGDVEGAGEEGAEEEANSASLLRSPKALLLLQLGRLALSQTQPFADVLPGKLVSHLESANLAVASAAGDILHQLKKAAPQSMHKVYLVALETAFERDRGVSDEVRALAKRVAGFHSGFVANAATSAAKIIQGGIAYAFQGNNLEGLGFLEALQTLAPRVAAKDSESLAAALEAAAAPRHPAVDQERWECYFDLVTALRERKSKGRGGTPKSALRNAASPPKQPGRKISFAEAGKRRKAPPKSTPRKKRSVEDEDEADDSGHEAPASEPRYHTKTRRGSALASSPSGSGGLATMDVDERQDNQYEQQDEDMADDVAAEESGERALPSGMFLAGETSGSQKSVRNGGSSSGEAGSDPAEEEMDEDDDDEEEEEEIPNIHNFIKA